MSEFIGTTLLTIMVAAATYYLGKTSTTAELRHWQQRAQRAEKLADDMGRAAMENYIDIAVAELRSIR
jgi:hypothetical protein